MRIVVGFGCLLVAAVLASGIAALPDDEQAPDSHDDDIQRMEKRGKYDKRACTDLSGNCISLKGDCKGEWKIGTTYCKRSTKFGCCVPYPPKTHDCVMDDKVFANGDVAEDRCIYLACNNGTWDYYDWNYDCSACRIYGDDYARLSPYVPHKISDSIDYSYYLDDYDGNYTLSQSGLSYPAPLTVDITRTGKCSTTNTIYREPGVNIEISFSTILGPQISVGSWPYPITSDYFTSSNTSIPVAATFGTVYIIFQWGNLELGGIYIVGSQGISMETYFSCPPSRECCYVRIISVAMPSLHNQLYGLCDVNPPEVPPYPQDWTMSGDGGNTENLSDFIDSWKIPRPFYLQRTMFVNETPYEKRSNIGVEKSCEENNKGPCKVLRPVDCKRLIEDCVSHMNGSSKRDDASK